MTTSLSFLERQDLLLVDKPVGLSTHSPGNGEEGVVELLQKQLQRPLYVCHRLDKLTSGALVLAMSKEAAAALTNLFETRQVNKRYLLVSNKTPPLPERFEVRSHIRKYRGRFVSWPRHEDLNAETNFSRIGQSAEGSHWLAEPKTGKSHQIRLHARQMGIPILGDKEHGGANFRRLMLHAESLSFPWHGGLLTHLVKPEAEFLVASVP